MKKKIILLVVCVCVICFIWANSVLSPEISSAFSSWVGNVLSGIFGEGDATQTVGGLSVRKLGHFVEFLTLGIVLTWFLTAWVKQLYSRCFIAAFSGLFVPVMDETIQIFSGRGSSLRDVWIDVAGYTVGVSLVCIAFYLIKRLKNRVKNNNKT